MKILVIHTTYKTRGGEESVVASEVAELRSAGHEVYTFTFNNDVSKLQQAFLIAVQAFNPASYFKVRRELQRLKPDIVHLHNWNFAASPSVINAVKHAGIPIVLTIHNFRLLCPSATLFNDGKLFLDSLQSDFPWSAVKKGVYRNSRILTFWLALAVYLHRKAGTWKSVDKYIVLSDFARKIFLESRLGLDAGQMIVKANFTNSELTLNSGIREPFFLYVGRLTEEKGIKVLMDAFRKLDNRLVIIGDGPMRTVVENVSRETANIEYRGVIPNDEVKNLMSSASALLFPSIWFEGMPITIVEAYSMSLPVIASKIGAMMSMVEDMSNGMHFTAGSVEDLVRVIKKWSDMGPDESFGFQLAAYDSYRLYYRPEISTKVLVSLYKDLLTKTYNRSENSSATFSR